MILAEISLSLQGRVLARTICSSDGEVILPAGAALGEICINDLKELGIATVYITDVDCDDSKARHGVSAMTRLEALKVMRELAQRARSGQPLGAHRRGSEFMLEVVDSIILDVMANPLTVAACAELISHDECTYLHSVNTCLISLRLGRRAGLGRERLRILGLGALLHDVGKVYIPGEILNKPGRLEPEEYEVIKKHSRLGWLALKGLADTSPTARHASLHHHERHDGQGYPEGLAGEEINWVARFIAVADVFDALTSDRPYRKAIPYHRILAEHLPVGNPAYDPVALQLLHKTASQP